LVEKVVDVVVVVDVERQKTITNSLNQSITNWNTKENPKDEAISGATIWGSGIV